MGWRAVLVGFVILGLLWILDTPYREFYVPNALDVPALADGLLLAPGAQWQDWFTRGYSNFWDAYPEWPPGNTGFTRPAFQFVIYLAQFALGSNWELYRIIGCIAAASVPAIAFLIARTALGLRTGLSLLAAALVLLSPPILDCWKFGLANAHELLTTFLVACAFLAVVARRDFLCLMLLCVALLTKENAMWAPAAAALTIMLRPKPDETLCHQAIAAAAMFLPVLFWLALRLAFFGGIGGTYVTEGYAQLGEFLVLTFRKLRTLDALFVGQPHFAPEAPEGADRAIAFGTRLLTYALFSLLALRIMSEIANRLRDAIYERRWPTVEVAFLVSLWAAIALAFHFTLALTWTKYATSVVVFAWPALVAEIDRRRQAALWLGLTVFCVVSTLRTYRSVEFERPPDPRKYSAMREALHQLPKAIRQVYVVAEVGDALPFANPEYVRLILGVPAEIVRIVDIGWNCRESNNLVAFDHSIANGGVKLTATLPACANFIFLAHIGDEVHANGHLHRNATLSYELPEASLKQKWSFEVGRRITVHVYPSGPARFIIQHGGPNGIAWFDTP